ncbi:MAG: CvpA family protein [Holosporales bacterium]|jgi:membrane protein required for colicin V production|nr:CvpA family protein [Holosporales bacterium]
MENISFFIIDIFIVSVIVLSFAIGWARGATKEILSVLSWVGGIYLTVSIFPDAKSIARSYINHGLIADFVTVCILFILFLTILSVINYVCSNFVRKSILNTTDKALGGAFGIFRGAIILAALDFVTTQCFFSEIPQIIENSRIRPMLASISNFMVLMLPDSMQEKIVSHLSQAKRQNLIDFLKDDIFENIGANNIVKTEINKKVKAFNGAQDENIEENKAITENQTAEELSKLKTKKVNQEANKETKKTKSQEVKERLDMDRLLDQYDN